jgi:single-stranded DNA-specific DHH superfamily exonuclease
MMLMALLLFRWFHLFKNLLPNVATYIPDRYDEGYGISFKGIDFADDNGFRLLSL